jgi:hypothetical protein
MIRLIYVSRSRIPYARMQEELDAIVKVAVGRNLANGVTGALVHTGSSFAQILEGNEDAVGGIMGSILIDPRHEDVRIVGRYPAPERRFPNWGMSLFGTWSETQAHVDAIRAAPDLSNCDAHIEALVRQMEEQASASVRV